VGNVLCQFEDDRREDNLILKISYATAFVVTIALEA